MAKRISGIFILLLAIVAAPSCRHEASVWDDPAMWFKGDSSAVSGSSAAAVDVFYIVSTDVLSAKDADGNVSWRSLLSDEDRDAMGGEIAWVQRNMFHDDFRFIAPYYHQFTFDAISQLDSVSFSAVYRDVAAEVCDAFDHYMDNQNGGRPFILAGFSQGAMLTLDVLKHMSDEQFSRMVACYTLGYRLSAEDLAHPHVNAAAGASDTGVVISFNSSQTREAIWPFVSSGAATCINPINWMTDSTPAEFSFSETSNTVHVDPQTHTLLVETDSPEYFRSYYELAPFFQDAGVSTDNLHHWDLLFYASYIHDNAVLRSEQ